MSAADGRFVGHARTVMALTLVSRVSGMARDAVCSRVFGASPVWSAFVTAFIVPNLFRRLFGEGAISAAFIPEYAQAVEREPEVAGRFAALTVALMLAVVGGIVVVLEAGLGVAVAMSVGEGTATRDVMTLAMVMLPFAPLVCATAMLGGMLQTHGRFVPHAASPVILNVAMIAAAAGLGFGSGAGLAATAMGVAVAVLVAGVVQLAWCAASLRGLVSWRGGGVAVGDRLRRMLGRLVPVLIGMGTLQLGTLIDGLLAGWPVVVGPRIGGAAYPMDEGAASVLFYAARLYQFPLGVFGIAIATAVFPALSRQAGDPGSFGATLRRGLRVSLFIGAPATAGLLLVARDASAVIYLGGEFGVSELDRVTRALLCYAPAIWAYALTHVLTRSFYARGETRVPMVVGMGTVGLNLALNLTLMWSMAEAGLALATSVAATAQCVVLGVLARRRLAREGVVMIDSETARSLGWSAMASVVMAGAVWGAAAAMSGVGEGWTGGLVRLAVLVGVGGAVYLGAAAAMRRRELGWLLERGG